MELLIQQSKMVLRPKLYHQYNNTEKEIKLPKSSGHAILYSLGSKKSYLGVILEGWINPKQYYKYDYDIGAFSETDLFPDFKDDEFQDLIVEELLVKSHDGEEIPLSLIYKKGLVKNGSSPVLMRGYGAYGNSMKPNAYYGFFTLGKRRRYLCISSC